MENLLKKKLYIALLFIGCSVCVEILSFLVMGMGVLPLYWGFDLGYVLLWALVLFLIPNSKVSMGVSIFLLLLQIVVSFVNEALLEMSGIAFGLTMLNLGNEVAGVFDTKFVNWWFLSGMLLILGGAITGMVFAQRKIPVKKSHKFRNQLIVVLVAVFSVFNASTVSFQTTFLSFNQVSAQEGVVDYNDDFYLYDTQFISAKALRRFGYYGFYSVQLSNTAKTLVGALDKDMDEKTLSKLDEYFANGQMSSGVYGDNVYTGTLNGKNLVVIAIESGEWYTINKEYTPTLYTLATEGLIFGEYHARDKTNHSEAMSILGSYPGFVSGVDVKGLKGHNLSFTLPNLLKDQGYTANYFHASEGSFYDRDKTHGSGGYFGYDKGNFLENMNEMDGHHYKRDFYDFDKEAQLFDNYFEEYTYTKEGSDKFYTMHMTLSSHGHYDDLIKAGDYPFTGEKNQEALKKAFSASDNRDVKVKGFEKYYEVIDSYPETYVAADKGIKFGPDVAEMTETEKRELYLRFKRYQAGMMDLDEGINTLLHDLDAAGKLDDTAFFFYADHSAYYHDLNYHLKGVSAGEFWNTEVYNIPCMIWYGGSMNCQVSAPDRFYEGYNALNFTAKKDTGSALQGKTRVDKFTCSFDIIPTILQLMGLDHNLNMYHGVSMLTENASTIFVSLESGIFTNEYYYDGMTVFRKETDGRWTEFDYETLTESLEGLPQDVQAFLDESVKYYTRQDAFNKIYKLDYYRYRALTETYEVNGKIFAFVKNKNTEKTV